MSTPHTLELLTAGAPQEIRNAIEAVRSKDGQSLFIVAGIMDLTNFIKLEPGYKVNLEDGYDSWTDSNFTVHRNLAYQKINGTFTLWFETVEQFQTFLVVMNEVRKQDGSYPCTAYCVNKLESYTTDLFVDFDPTNVMPLIETKQYDGLEITVSQRGNLYNTNKTT